MQLERIADIYENCKHLCGIIATQRPIPQLETIEQLEKLLNSAQPFDSRSKGQRQLLVKLCKKTALCSAILREMPYLVLWLGPKDIKQHLLCDHLRLNWRGQYMLSIDYDALEHR